MDPIKISHHLKISSMEEMNDFSVKLGWDAIIYSQLGAGIFDGEYLEGINQSLIVTKENISVPLSMKGGGVPGYIALGMYLSSAPAKVNGLDLQPTHFVIIKPGAEFDFASKGPGDIFVTLLPESRFEEILGNAIENLQVFHLNKTNEGAMFFKSWFQNWPSHQFWQTKIGRKALTHQLEEIVYSSLENLAENLGKKAGKRGTSLNRSKKKINRLMDYLHSNPDQSISINEMCQIAGLSRRNLFYNFKEYSGHSPSNFFKFIRLSALHRDLLSDSQSLTNLAVKYNFFHLGEFSDLYKKTFGELPSQTQKKICGNGADSKIDPHRDAGLGNTR